MNYEIKPIRFSGYKLALPEAATTPAPSNSTEEMEIPKMNWVWDDKDEGPVVPDWWHKRFERLGEPPK